MTNTGTFAKLVSKREYTEPEKVVLSHFFTNLDKNIYCPTTHMPFPVWTFLVGQYSRSNATMRDRFLDVFDDMNKKVKAGEWPASENVTIEKAADAINNSNFHVLDYFFKTAESFLAKWGVAYGHSSLKDADKTRVAIEGISQLVTNFIEMPDPELGDYQEKSTRYITFGKEDVVISPRLQASRFAARVKENNDALMDSYTRLTPVVKKWLGETIVDRAKFKTDRAFENTLNAKAFDMMRYWLPQGLTTSLGATWPTRVAESHISQMLTHPLEELNLIGQSTLEECVKISPGLLRHVKPNAYFGETTPAMYSLVNTLLSTEKQEYHRGDRNVRRAKLLSHTPDFEQLLLTGILYEFAEGRSWENVQAQVSQFTDEQKDTVFKEYLSKRGDHDLMLRGTKLGRFVFEYLVDNGAWRDVKRQRVGTMLKQDITASLGYAYPEYVEDASGLQDVKLDYEQKMEATTALFNDVVKEFPRDASYIPAMGHLGRNVYEFHARQGAYVVELRTPEAGHYSYKSLFRDTFHEINRVLPRFGKYIRATLEENAIGRQKAEENAADKAAKQLEADKKRAAQ